MGNTFARSSKGAHEDGNTPPPPAPSQPNIPSRPQCQPLNPSRITNHTVDSIKNYPVRKEPSEHATGSEKAQAKWYNIFGWKVSPPTTSEEASSLVSQVIQVGRGALTGFHEIYEQIKSTIAEVSSLPAGVKYKLNTLPVKAKLVGDGDGMTVHISTEDPRVYARVPLDVRKAAEERRKARAIKDYHRADKIRESMKQTDYRFGNEDDLVRVCRIRLRGIDAPEMEQEYGQEAKDALRKLIQEKPLQIYVYDTDTYGRLVGDVYCHGVFVQERLLKKGCAWHYEAFDKRPEFAQWEKEARNARRGLWANPNPVAPWDFKRNDTNKKNGRKPFCSTGRNSQRDYAFAIYAS